MPRTKSPRYTAATADRHELYEKSVQGVEAEIDFVVETFRARTGRPLHLLKEDFCGTFQTSCEFLKRSDRHRAWGVDLDGPTLDWGRKHNLSRLSRDAQHRMTVIQGDVRRVSKPRLDAVLAMNFSYFLFTDRTSLGDYFSQVRKSLKKDGVLFLDAYGGSDAQVVLKEKTKHKHFTYVWDQAEYNPLTNIATCHIHFHFPDGTKMKKAFSYTWRLWTPREITDLLLEVGYSAAEVYWERWEDDEDEPSGEFERVEDPENTPGWVCYIVADA